MSAARACSGGAPVSVRSLPSCGLVFPIALRRLGLASVVVSGSMSGSVGGSCQMVEVGVVMFLVMFLVSCVGTSGVSVFFVAGGVVFGARRVGSSA